MTLAYTTITGTFKDGAGKNLTGKVTFAPSCTVYDSAGTVLTADLPITAQIVDGALQGSDGSPLTLLATDNDGLTVEGLTGFWYWTAGVAVAGDTTPDTFGFFLPASPVTVDLYALANTSAGGGGGGGAVTSVDGLTGAVVLSGVYLDQASNLSDVPSAAAARSNLGLGTVATHAVTEFLTKPPWEFRVGDYGAKGDGKIVTDAAMTSGSPTLTSATAGFTSADVGKHIMINNAGLFPDVDHCGALITSISAYINSTTVTLASNAARAASGQSAVYGTDDTAAIQSAMAAIQSAAVFVNAPHHAELVLDAKIYVLATPPTPGALLDGEPTYGYAQIPIPVLDVTSEGPKRTLVFRGATSDNSTLDAFEQTVPQINGACLLSMVDTPAAGFDSTYRGPCVIGGPTIETPFDAAYNNITVVIDAIQIVAPPNPGVIALNFAWQGQFAIKTCSLNVFASSGGTPQLGETLLNQNGMGLKVPVSGLNDRCDIDSLSIEGYYYGMTVDEHINAQRVAIIWSNTCLYVDPGTAQNGRLTHGAWFGYVSAEICEYCIYVPAAIDAGSQFPLVIDMLDNEGAVTAHIQDANSILFGVVYLQPTGGQNRPVTTVVNGAGNLEVKSLIETRGAFTPTVPATTVASAPIYRDVDYYVTAGALTALSIDGVAVGAQTHFRVPSGKLYTPTYSSVTLKGVKA